MAEQAKVEALFLDAVELPANQRSAFLDQHCGDDSDLRQAVETLLSADAAAGGEEFLEADFFNAKAVATPSGNFRGGNFRGGDAAYPARALDSSSDDPDSCSSDEPRANSAQGIDPQSRGRFRILSRHRQGGLGEVLIAYDRQLNRDVAIKQIKPKWQSHQEARHRFAQEAEVTARLEHPGVVPVYAMGTWEDGRPYYAMRFIQGTTLADEIAKYHSTITNIEVSSKDEINRTLELRNLLNRFVDVCNTIEYAHSRQVLHRDIKPSNIMAGRYGETLVVDWGLAKLLDTPFSESVTAGLIGERQSQQDGSTPTQVGGAVGTPQYMSPEQASCKLEEIGIRTDVYLLGATLYQILTGKPPHEDESVSKMIDRVKRGELIRPRLIAPNVPSALESICLKAMAMDSASRYRSARRLSADIERWLADEPISVHAEPVAVRIGRWLRRHRTIAASVAVATVLLTVGSIGGSLVWNYQQAEQFRIEQEKVARETELEHNRLQRVAELQASVESAETLAQTELRAGRFPSALNILDGELQAIHVESEFADARERLQRKRDRLQRIVHFYQQADLSHIYNALNRDTKATLASTSALDAMGVLETDTWWNALPDEDLTPRQQDRLRWDVYRQLTILDALMVKAIGTRLSGSNRRGKTAQILSLTERYRTTSLGKPEAEIALTLCDRIDRFRPSEATRWYRSIANFRLQQGVRLRGSDLEAPRNAADAHSLGVLCMIAALDRSFQIVFRDYQDQDSLQSAKDLFRWASDVNPTYYWTQLSLAQTIFLHERENDDSSWRKYDAAIQAAGRCIALEPDKCFAYADRSSMFRAKAELISKNETLSPDFRENRISELLRWSLEDANKANQLGRDQPWIGWQHGLALAATGQNKEALDRFLEASKRTLPFASVEDAALVTIDDIRGRQEASELAGRLLKDDPNRIECQTLIASILLNQHRFEDAIAAATKAIAADASSSHAFAVRGMARHQLGNDRDAADDFRVARTQAPDHDWVSFGLAAYLESEEEYSPALDAYEHAFHVAKTDEHRSACLFGKSRVLAFQNQFSAARESVDRAFELEPAGDIKAVGVPLRDHYLQLRRSDPDSDSTQGLLAFIQWLHRRPRPTDIRITPNGQSFRAAILNHDFELGSMTYWSGENGVNWSHRGDDQSQATVVGIGHKSSSSLHIVGDRGSHDTRFGMTQQVFPAPRGSDLKLSVWVRAANLSEGALSIGLATAASRLTLPAGSYGWRRFEWSIPSTEEVDVDPTTIVSCILEITSSGSGEAWLDDIEVMVESKKR